MIAPDTACAVSAHPASVESGPSTTSQRDARYDAGLVRRFNSGDAAAFEEIVLRYRTKMLHVALPLLRNHADAEEIAQDTFVRAHRGLANFRGDSSLAAWLHRIALNLSRNRYWYFRRRHHHRTLSLDSEAGGEGNSVYADLITSSAPDPARAAARREFAAHVAVCIERLNRSQREVLILRTNQNCSYREISRQLGIEIGTVKSRIGRTRKRLRVLLAETYASTDQPGTDGPWFEPYRPDGLISSVEN